MKTPHNSELDKVQICHNLAAASLIEKSIQFKQGRLNSTGALAVNTGKFTGRSPKDRYIVKDRLTEDIVHWGDINIPFSSEQYAVLYKKVIDHLNQQDEIYCRDAHACANEDYRLNVRVYNEQPWQNLFVHNMFLRPTSEGHRSFVPEWTIYAAPFFLATPKSLYG